VCLVLLAIATVIGALWWLLEPRPRTASAILRLVTPAALVVAASAVLCRLLAALWHPWSDPRLAPSFAFRLGYSVYPLEGAPLLGHVYGAIPPLVYLPATWAKTPTVAILTAAAIATAFSLGPVLWLTFAATRGRRTALFPLALFAGFVLASQDSHPLHYSLYAVHVDAIALGLSALSCGLLAFGGDSRWRLPAAAVLAVLAVWSKQVMVPLLVALPVFLLVTEGKAAFRRFVVWTLLAGALVSGAMIALFGARNLWFNMFFIPGRHERNYANLPLYCEEMIVFTYVSLVGCLFALLTPRLVPASSDGVALHRHPWFLFFLVALFMTPLALLARTKYGGDVNSYSSAVYFFVLAALLWLGQLLTSSPENNVLRATATLLLAVSLAVTSVKNGIVSLGELRDRAKEQSNPSQVAYEFLREKPGFVYFPWNPSATMMAEGRLYHFAYPLHERDRLAISLTAEQFAEHFPTGATAVAFPPKAPEDIRRYLPQFSRLIFNARFPYWRIFGPPPQHQHQGAGTTSPAKNGR
jgi:hypothetical protein